MNNMQKSFKRKSALRCMADGGAVAPTIGELNADRVAHNVGQTAAEVLRQRIVDAAKQSAAISAAFQAARAVAPRVAALAGPVGGAVSLGKQLYDETRPGGMLTRPEPTLKVRYLDEAPAGLRGGRNARRMAEGGAVYKSVGTNGVPNFSDDPSSGALYSPGSPVPAPAPPQSIGPPSSLAPAPLPVPPPAAKISPLAIGPKSNLMGMTGGFGPTPAPQSTYMKAGGTGAIGSQPSSIGANRAEIGANRTPIGAPRMGALGRPIMTSVGYARGGKVTGPGGPTEDKVPAMLSAGEYVLPADTVKKVGVQNLDALKDATHKPSGQSKLRGNVREFAVGGYVQSAEEIRRAALEAQNRVQQGLPAPGDRWGSPQPATKVTTPTTNVRVPAPPIVDKSFAAPNKPAVTANVPSGYGAPRTLPAGVEYGRGTVPPGAPAIPQNTAAERIINNNLIAQQGAGIPKQPPQVTLGAAKAAPAAVASAAAPAAPAAVASAAAPAAPAAVASAAAPAAPAAAAPAAQAAAKPGLLARGGSALAGWGKGLVNGAAKLATPVVATYGAVQAIGDNSNGYADYRGDGGGAGGHTGRVLETLGNAFTGGYAEKLVQGMGATLEGDDFSAGWNLPTRRDEYLANRRDPITNALPSASGQAGYVAPGNTATDAAAPAPGTTPALPEGVLQRPDGIYQQGNSFSNVLGPDGKPQFLPQERMGPPSPAAEAYLARTPEMQFGPVPSGPGSSLRSGRGGGMRLNMPSAQDTALRSINARFDKLAENYAKNADPMSPSKTARTMADLEQARTNALNGVMGNDTNRRGQDMAASSAAARDAAGLAQEGMRGQFALLSGQAAANLAAQKAQTEQELKFTEEDRANFDQMYGDAPEKGEAYATYAANRHLLPQGIEGVQQAGAMLGMLKAAGLAPGTRIEAFGANPVTGGAGSEESDPGTRYTAAGGGLRGIGAALNPADWLGDDNYYTIHTKAGPKKVARRSLRGGDSQMQTWQELLGRNIKE